ncbi:riboflavin synthase, partial [bacterium]
VAVDGISLTVNECARQRFSVAIIPHTLRHTNLLGRRVGDKVNIETDIVGKYVQRLLGSGRPNRETSFEDF